MSDTRLIPDGLNAHECLLWSELLDYEKMDVVRSILSVLSSSLFSRDALYLVEREELESSSHESEAMRMNSLVLAGRVGYTRHEAMVSLVRDLRLRHVRDLVSFTTAGYVVGDRVPHLMLHPLEENAPVCGYRRWHRARCAMHAGLLLKLEERREQTRSRLRVLLRPTSVSKPHASQPDKRISVEGGSSEDSASTFLAEARAAAVADGDSMDNKSRATSARSKSRIPGSNTRLSTAVSTADDGFKDLFTHSASGLPSDRFTTPAIEKDYEMKRLALFEAGVKEKRLDINAVAATVPTIFVVWSYLFNNSVAWLRKHLFNDDAMRQLDSINGGVPERFAVVFGVDPWLHFAEKYIKIPPRRKPDEKVQRQRVLPITNKRAQIVLVNVDRDEVEARGVFKCLVAECKGWSSQEVSMISLWVGEDGLQSPFCKEFGIHELPLLVTTLPMRRRMHPYRLEAPRIASISSPKEEPANEEKTSPSSQTTRLAEGFDKGIPWHQYPAKKREDLCQRMAAKLSSSCRRNAAPFRFCAYVEKTYAMLNPHATVSSKAVRFDSTSGVVMRGLICETDCALFREELAELAAISDFEFDVRVMKSSGPVKTLLDSPTPTRIVQNIRRAITCCGCLAVINVDTSAHYRCLHCEKQGKGILCLLCGQKHMAMDPNPAPQDGGGLGAPGRTFEALPPRARSQPLSWEYRERQQQKRQKDLLRVSSADVGSHARHHIFLRIPPLVGELVESEVNKSVHTIPLLWGGANVRALPLFRGRLIVNTSQEHIGIYCNHCRCIVKGIRWKCAVCYEYDLCDPCFHHQQQMHHPSAAFMWYGHHTNGHPMLCIPYAIDGYANSILIPEFIEDPLPQTVLASTPPRPHRQREEGRKEAPRAER